MQASSARLTSAPDCSMFYALVGCIPGILGSKILVIDILKGEDSDRLFKNCPENTQPAKSNICVCMNWLTLRQRHV